MLRKVAIYRMLSFIRLTLCGCGLLMYGKTNEYVRGIVLEADKYDVSDQTVTASQNAILRGKDIFLNADRIIWDQNASLVRADGSVSLGVVGYRLLAESLVLDLESGTFTAEKVKTGLYPWVLEAEQMVATDSNYSLSDIFLKHENHERLSPSLSIDSLHYDINRTTATAKTIGISIDGKVIAQIPKLKKNLKDRSRNIDFLLGRQEPLGWFLGARFHFSPEKRTNYNLKVSSYFDRGIYFSPEINFGNQSTGYDYETIAIKLGAIKDHGLEDNRIKDERGFARLSALINREEQWHIALAANPQTDSGIFRDYERDLFMENQWIENFAETTYHSDLFSLSILADFSVNDYEYQVEEIPSIQFYTSPFCWWNNHFHDIAKIEYSSLKDQKNAGKSFSSTNLFDLAYKTSGVIKINNWIKYIPSATLRSQHFNNIDFIDARRNSTEIANELNIEALSPIDAPLLNIMNGQCIHYIKISLEHKHMRWLSNSSNDAIFNIEEHFIDPYLRNPNLFDLTLSDDFTNTDVIRFGLDNSILSFDNFGSTSEIASLQLFYDINFNDTGDQNKQDYFYWTLKISPHSNLFFNYYTKLNIDSGEQPVSNLNIVLKDGNVNEFEISLLKFSGETSNIQYLSRHFLNIDNSLELGFRYNPENGDIPFWTLNFETNVPLGWKWNTFISRYDATNRDELLLGVKFNLFSF